MKKVLTTCWLLLVALCAEAQFGPTPGPGTMFSTDGKPLTDDEARRMTNVWEKMDKQLNKADMDYLKSHNYDESPTNPVYQKVRGIINSEGFSEYGTFQVTMGKVMMGFACNKMEQDEPGTLANLEAQLPMMDQMMNSGQMPAAQKGAMEGSIKMLKRMITDGKRDAPVVKPYMARLSKYFDDLSKKGN